MRWDTQGLTLCLPVSYTHLMLNQEPHVKDITFMTTLEGYVHWKLTGEKVLGVGEGSGMFPIDMEIKGYDKKCLATFDELAAPYGFPWKLEEILPKVLLAGEEAGRLTEEGAKPVSYTHLDVYKRQTLWFVSGRRLCFC